MSEKKMNEFVLWYLKEKGFDKVKVQFKIGTLIKIFLFYFFFENFKKDERVIQEIDKC